MSSDAASRRIGAFTQRFGAAHLALACHAAFPLALTPDLLYRLWAHFQLDAQGAPLRVPWVAVADLLLSGMCREVGHELFELEPAVRAALLRELRDSPRFGHARIAELGRFLLDYVGQLLLSDSPDERDFAESQQWTALAYVRPDEAMRRLAQAARRAAGANHAERVRVRALVETLAAPLGDHAEFAALLAGVRAKAQPAQAPQQTRGTPRRKANPRPIKVPRATKPPTAETPEQSDAAPLCVLAIISAPTNLDDREWARVDGEREWADMRTSLAALDPAVFALDRLEPPTTERLRSQLAQADYDVVHFVGHIAIDQDNASWDVTLQDEQGRASNMDGQEFTALLARHTALQLVVLNVAQLDPELGNDLFLRAVQIALREPVAAVLLVPPGARDATRAFNTLFYTALAQQQPIEQALDTANHAARQTGAAWAEPTLFSHAPDGSITSTMPADADDDQTPQLLAQRDQLRRRLQQLERQRALYGIDLPVRILADIQDTQRALAAIEAQLAGTPPPEQKTVSADAITQALLTQVGHQRRRLRALEQQEAYYGVNAPAHIVAEIEEARRELDKIYPQLRATGLPVADELDALDADGIEHLQQLRLTKLRRLRIRERQKAALGDQAEAVMITEMSELHTEIAQIEQQLRNTNATPTDPPKPDPAPTTPGLLADEERAGLAELRYTTQRRLREREKQRATMGDTSARPEILMEIEDLQARLQILDSQLGQAPPTAESLAHTQEIRQIKLRRLREIERMVAQFGSQAPKHLVDEGNILRNEVAQIEQQLRDLGVAPADSNAIPTPTPAPEQPAAPTLDHEERAPLEAQYHMIERRLKILERQQARLGYDTPPEVSTELEDLRRRLAALAGRLGGPPPPPAPRPQPAPADPEHRPLIEAQRELEIERLRALEVQRARYGEAHVPPEIVIDIENLLEEIADLDGRLGITAAAPGATGQRAALEQLRAIRMERLRVLETQQARYSAELAPVSMLVEIEELRNEIAEIDQQLRADGDEQLISQEVASEPDSTRDQQYDEKIQELLAAATWVTGQGGDQNVVQAILDTALKMTDSNTGTLHLYDSERNDLVLAAERGVRPELRDRRLRMDEGIIGLTASQRTLLNIPNVTAAPWASYHIADIPGSRSEIAVPLVDGGELRGVLNIESSRISNYSQLDERLLLALADLAVTAIKKAGQMEREQGLENEAQTNNADASSASVTTRWGTLRLSAALDGLAPGAPLRIGQVYQVRIAAQLTPSEIAQVHSQASVGEQALELELALDIWRIVQPDPLERPMFRPEDTSDLNERERRVRLIPGEQPSQVFFQLQPTHIDQALLMVDASADGRLLAQLQLSFAVEDMPPAEQQAQPQPNAPATPAQAPDEPALERSSEIDVSIALRRGSEQLSPGPDRTYTLTLSELYALQVSVQLTRSLTEDSIAMNLGELPLHRRIVVQAQNLIVEGEHQQQVSFAIGGPWAKAEFILRPATAGAAAAIVSTYDRENLEDQQRLSFEVLAAPPTQA